jgi:hypothetical protein
MAAKKFLRLVAGTFSEVVGIVTSLGAANDGDIPALDSTGRLDASVMPVGLGAETVVIAATENLAAGDWINIYDSTGAKCRKADAATNKPAVGFVLNNVTSGANATIYLEGTNTAATGKTPGARQYLSATTPGLTQETQATGAGVISQCVGWATGATTVTSQVEAPVTLIA